MTLEGRLNRLENTLKGQGKMSGPGITTEDVIRKLGLDPDWVRATAKENGQSMAEVIARELGMSYKEFREALKLRAQGK